MIDNTTMKGHVKWEVFENGAWVYGGENHNVTTDGYKALLAQQLATGTAGVVANQMAAGTATTTFAASSTALGTEVSRTTSLTNTYTGAQTTCVGIILFSGSYTIKEIGLYFGTTALAFANITETVTSLKPLRISWTVQHL